MSESFPDAVSRLRLGIIVTKPEQDSESGAEESSPEPSMNTASRLKQVTLTQDPEGDEARSQTEPPPGGVVDPYIGATVDGRYFVEAQLGEGGMGVVYRCRHTIIDKKVAMKVLRADMARNEEVTERFLNEARSASSIGNPHIIDISDFGRLPDGATYFIMEFLVGTPLADLAEQREPMEPTRVGHIALQLTEGLADAHDAGIIHRDLKPDNIFLVKRGSQEDFVKILDFGIAKASSNNSKLTQAGQVFGTPHYMSPEQASGSPVDLRSDIYALGVIMYELLTGQLPFDADNFMAILTQHMYKAPTAPTELGTIEGELPGGLEDVVLRCMAKEPGERYQTMSALGSDLRKVFSGTAPDASRDSLGLTDNYGSPQEYYEARSARGSSPGAAPKSNSGTYIVLGAVAALAAGAAVWFGAQRQAPTPEPVVVEAPAAPEPPKEPVEEAPQPTQVVIAVAPLKAHVFQGEDDLGESPVMVDVGNEALSLSVKLEGYETRELIIDGKDPKVSVELKEIVVEKPVKAVTPRPSPKPQARPTPAPRPKPKPKLGGGELVNPWGD